MAAAEKAKSLRELLAAEAEDRMSGTSIGGDLLRKLFGVKIQPTQTFPSSTLEHGILRNDKPSVKRDDVGKSMPPVAEPTGKPQYDDSFLDSVDARASAAAASSPKLLDLSTPQAQAEMKRFIMDAPAAKVASTAEMPATPAAPAAGRDINALFAKATGTAFDPKSRMDIAKKQELEALLKGSPDLAGKSDTQVALQYYRQMANSKRK